MRKALVAVLALVSIAACKEDKPQGPIGAPPPPPPAAASGGNAKSLCDPAAVGISDPKLAALLPSSVDGWCVLKADAVRSWGEGTPKKIEDVSDIIDGAGEIYAHNYFAKRFDALKYVEGNGSGADVELYFSTFDKPENAYGLFTYKTVANQDPDPAMAMKQGRTPLRKLSSGGASVLGNANAILWKGNWVAELTYSPDPTKSKEEATKAADAILPKIAEAIAQKLVGTVDPPPDVRLLPNESEGRIALGIDFVPQKFKKPEGKGDALHINAGSYAQAFMKEGNKRYRVLAFSREEKDAARDAMAAFSKMPGAIPLKEVKDFADDGWHFPFQVGQGGAGAAGKAEGVAARKGSVVMAVIDEELALGDPQKKDEWPRLSKEEKVAKLKQFLTKPAAPSASAPAPSASAPPASSK